jgi:hypothetical protein
MSIESSTCASFPDQLQATTALDDAISQCGFAVINMGNDGEISDVIHRKSTPERNKKPCGKSTRLVARCVVGQGKKSLIGPKSPVNRLDRETAPLNTGPRPLGATC